MLGVIAQSLGEPSRAGLIAMCTQIGYAAGLVLLVPLGDRLERRQLILSQCMLLFCSIAGCALAPNFVTLAVASVLVGVCATIAQQLVPLAADLAEASRRARAIGAVYIGSLLGILLARIVSGFVSQVFGWRAMFWLAACVTLAMAVILWKMLPRVPPRTSLPYGRLLGSMWDVWVRHPQLRKVVAMQACLFGAFSVFWSVFALRLQGPPFHLGPAVAGMFGIIGVVGVAAVSLRGRLAARHDVSASAVIGAVCCAVAFVTFAFAPGLEGLAAGIVLLDIGVSLAQVSGQSQALGLEEGARSRINTVFMTGSFLGGAFGSGAASLAWHLGDWAAVSAVGFALSVTALGVHFLVPGAPSTPDRVGTG
jgi:predicted MFS family arabinose efflux permease